MSVSTETFSFPFPLFLIILCVLLCGLRVFLGCWVGCEPPCCCQLPEGKCLWVEWQLLKANKSSVNKAACLPGHGPNNTLCPNYREECGSKHTFSSFSLQLQAGIFFLSRLAHTHCYCKSATCHYTLREKLLFQCLLWLVGLIFPNYKFLMSFRRQTCAS